MHPDFLIIGAQKAGTTSLYETLRSHRHVFMPPEKELQFFSQNKNFKKGWTHYEHAFRNKLLGQVCGEASPHYLCQRVAAERILKHCRNTKLIVILRDPVERAFSHYRMTKRRGRTTESFDQAANRLLKKPHACHDAPDMDFDYLLLGEYARMLMWYEYFFTNELIHVMFLDDLRKKQYETILKLLKFLELNHDGLGRIGIHAHRGGEARFPRIDQTIRSNRLIKIISRIVFSPQQRRAFMYWFDTRFNVKPARTEPFAQEMRQALRHYFSDDTRHLQKLISRRIPWDGYN